MARGERTESEEDRPVADAGQATASSRRPVVTAVLVTSLAWLVLAGGGALTWRRPQPAAFQLQPPPATATPAPTPTPGPIRINVAGAVQQPGVYELPAGARIDDALAAAGGLAANADGEALSLARLVQDGEKLAVPTARPAQPAAVDAAADSGADLAVTRSENVDLANSTLIDINQASAKELDALPSIGPVTAQAIVDYRTVNGPFRAVEEIVKVKGIGPATMEKIKPLITVGD